MKIKKNDNVMMLSGKDRGKSGKVVRIFPGDAKVMIEGLNLLTRHQRPRGQGQKGQKIQIPRKVPVGTVMLVCPKCSQKARIGYRVEAESKQRVCKKCERAI